MPLKHAKKIESTATMATGSRVAPLVDSSTAAPVEVADDNEEDDAPNDCAQFEPGKEHKTMKDGEVADAHPRNQASRSVLAWLLGRPVCPV
jgi:hypothetical protein